MYNITPTSIQKEVYEIIDGVRFDARLKDKSRRKTDDSSRLVNESTYKLESATELAKIIDELETAMYQHARDLEFEQAALSRDKLHAVKSRKFISDTA